MRTARSTTLCKIVVRRIPGSPLRLRHLPEASSGEHFVRWLWPPNGGGREAISDADGRRTSHHNDHADFGGAAAQANAGSADPAQITS